MHKCVGCQADEALGELRGPRIPPPAPRSSQGAQGEACGLEGRTPFTLPQVQGRGPQQAERHTGSWCIFSTPNPHLFHSESPGHVAVVAKLPSTGEEMQWRS